MLNVTGCDHIDDLFECVSCFLDVDNVPDDITDKAKSLDDLYTAAFGICMNFNKDSREWYILEHNDSPSIYYITNDGDKEYFSYDFTLKERNILFDYAQKELEKQKKSELRKAACSALALGIVKSQNLEGDTLDVVIGNTVLESMPESFLNSYDGNGILSDTDKVTKIDLISERLYGEWVNGDRDNLCSSIEASIKKAEKKKDMALKHIQNISISRQ